MPTLTLAIPEEMKREMDKAAIINWSAVAREAIREKLEQLRLFKSIVAKSSLTEQEAIDFSLALGKKVNKSMHEKLKRMRPTLS